MRAAEEAAFARGISAEALMEEAGAGIARALAKFFPRAGKCLVFAGKGHNAGDALVAARWLAQMGWEIETRLIFPEKELSALTKSEVCASVKWQVGGAFVPRLRDDAAAIGAQRPLPHCPTIVLDGLLGLGAHPPLREPIRGACREINSLRDKWRKLSRSTSQRAWTATRAKPMPTASRADFTITVGCAKSGLVADSAIDFVGRLEVVPLDELQARADARPRIRRRSWRRRNRSVQLLPRRKYSAYKNQFGRIGIVAGSRGFTGAAIMCSLGALRAGAGLVELFVPEEIYEIVAARRRSRGDGQAGEILRRSAGGADRRLGRRSRSRQIAGGRNSRAYSRSERSQWWSTPTGSIFWPKTWRR